MRQPPKQLVVLLLQAAQVRDLGFEFGEADVALGTEGLHGLAQAPLEGLDLDRKSTRLNSSHLKLSRMPSSA